MRIGYIGHFGEYHTEWGVSEGLERFAEVDRYHFPALDRDCFTSRQYDVVLATCPHTLPLEFWQAQKGLKVAHYFDLICGWQNREKLYFPVLKEFDLVLASDGLSKEYAEDGINCRWFPQAVNTDWHYPLHGEYRRDVAFIGHGREQKRRELLAELSSRYDFAHLGRDNMCRGIAHSEVCATTKIMVADSAVNDRPGYWSNRVYLHLACAAFVLHPRVPGMDLMFTDREHLVYYDDLKDLLSKIDHYLPLEEERRRIGQAGAQLVKEHHSWTVRTEELWREISGLASSATQTGRQESEPSPMTSGNALARIASFRSMPELKDKKFGLIGSLPPVVLQDWER